MKDELFGEVIYAYTRKQAIEDGVLIDVTKTAKEAGTRYPTAITRTVWDEYIEPDEELKKLGQSLEGRLWDTLFMFTVEARKTKESILQYQLYFIMPGGKQKLVTLKAMCGPGDEGEPVISIMLPEED